MPIEKIDRKIEVYQVSKHFFVEVEERVAFGKKMFELYLYHEGYGIKDHLAGVLEETLEEYEESIEDVIAQDLIENICNYYTDHMKPSFVDEKTAVEQFINSFDK